MTVMYDPEPHDSHWARLADPWTSKLAGEGGFPKLRDRCLLFVYLYLDDTFTAEDVGRLCEEPALRSIFGAAPLGKSPWHRITDCQMLGWIDWVRDEKDHLVARKEDAGQPQGLRQLTVLGWAKARELLGQTR